MPEEQDQLYAGITETLKKHGIGLPESPTAKPAVEITAPPPKDNLLSGIHETLQKHGIAMPGGPPAPREDFTNKYNTALAPEQEAKFQDWAKGKKNAAGGLVLNDLPDYDVRGRWQQMEQMSPEERAKAQAPGAHGPDTWKKPSHITFSNESKYHGVEGHEGGVWGKDAEGKDTFTPGTANLKFHGPENLQKYFTEQEPGLKLLPTKTPRGLPEALAPTRAAKPSTEPAWATQALASVTKFPAEIMNGFLRGGEQLLDLPRRLITGDWESPTPKTVSSWAGKAAEAAKYYEPKEINATKFVGNLLGGLAGFAIPGFAQSAAGVELPVVATMGAKLLQHLGSNLIAFGFANTMSVKGAGGSDEDSKRALLNTLPQAALFAVAQTIPFDKLAGSPGFVNAVKSMAGKLGLPGEEIAKSPWLSKIMGMSATGTAFAGSGVIEGERDPASLAVSFLTGFFLHGLTGARSQTQKGFSPEEMKKFWDDHFKDYTVDWKETNKVNPEQWAAVKEILDAIKQEPIREVEPGKPILDQAGRPASPDDVQAALAKQPFERNAHEKFLADQAQKESREAIQPTAVPGTADIIPGTAARERTNVGEPTVDRLQRAVDVVGDSDAGKKLGDLLAGNQEDLANAFRAPGEAPGIPEITDKIMDLAQKVEDTGDPGAAKELHDFINSNLGALKGLPRWPAESTKPITPAPPMATAGHVSEDLGTPQVSKAPTAPAAPMGVVGAMAENLAAKPEAAPVAKEPLPEGVKEFMATRGTAGRVGVPKDIVSKEGRVARASERGDLRELVKALGGIRSDSKILENFEKEERLKLIGLLSKTGMGPDVMADTINKEHSHLGTYETDADLIRTLVDGSYKKLLNREAHEQQMGEYDEHISEEAERGGHSQEDVAAAEEALERQIASEEIAGRSAKPGEYDLEVGWPGVEETPALRSGAQKPNRLTTRLDELAAEYPDIDRDKASTVLRAFPDAENNHIAAMSADPEMFSQVARGNLAASEKAQLLKKATDAGAQGALPGMGGGETLFKVGEEAVFTKGLTTDNIKTRLGKSGTVSEIASESLTDQYSRGWTLRLKNGQMVMVFQNKAGMLEIGPKGIGADWEALGFGRAKGVAAEYSPMKFASMVELARDAGPRTFDHELWHHIERWLLTPKEQAAVIKQFGENEESRAMAYETWNPKEAPNTVFQKILDFFQRITKAITGKVTGEDVFAAARSGELFGREPMERGLPEALAPSKYRAAEEGGEGEGDPTRMDMGGLIRTNLMKPYVHADDILTGIQKAVGPGAVSKEHREAAYVLRGRLGEMNRQGFETASSVKPDRRMFDKMGVTNPNIPLEENPGVQFMSNMSQGRAVAAGMEDIAKKIQKENTDRVTRLEEVDAPLDTVRENYFGMLWTPDSRRAFNQAVTEAVEAGRGMEAVEGGVGGQTMNLNDWSVPDKAWVKGRVKELMAQGQGSDNDASTYLARRPFKGKEGFRQPKVFDDVMTGVEFGLTPASNNPVDIFQIKAAEMDRSIYANGAIKDYKERGDAQFNHVSKRVPDGWAKIDDRYGTVYGPYDPATGTKPIYGYWIFKAPVAEILNNSLSQSLYNNPYIGKAFKGVMATGNLLNQFQLISAYHVGFTSIETQVSAGAEVIKDVFGVMRGNRTVGDLGRTLAKYPTAMVRFAMEGNRALAEYANPSIDVPTNTSVSNLPNTPEYRAAVVAKAAELAGGGFTMEHRFRTQWTDKMIKEWYGGQKIKAALRSPIVLTEMVMKPVMDYIVPRQKAGVFGELVGRIMEQNPTMTLDQLRPELSEAWNRVDARLGQVRYDRLFMREGAKNAIQAVLRAPGWTGGTILEIGGAQVDAVRFIKEWSQTGKLPSNIPDRVAYTIALVGTMALANGLMTYLFTGEKPEGMDYWAFRTGQLDSKGRQVRFLMPSYMKDLFAWYQAPLHTAIAKTHPLWSMIGDLARNKDYFNTMIRDPESSQVQQLMDMGKYTLKQYIPFGVRGMQQIGEYAKFGEEPGRFIAPQFGIMPAPRAYTNTPAQAVIEQYNQMTRSAYSTKEGAELKKLKSDLMKMARDQDETGFQEAASQAVSEGKMTRQKVKEIAEESKAPPGMARFTRLPLEWKLRTWDAASDYEKEQWQPYFLKSIMGEKPENLIKMREPVMSALKDMGIDAAADAVANLTMPEETGVDLTGLGLLKPAPEMSEMSVIDDAIAAALGTKLEGKVKKTGIRLPGLSPKEKKKPYGVLGL